MGIPGAVGFFASHYKFSFRRPRLMPPPPLQASPPQGPPNTACSGGGAPRRSGWKCGQKAALEDSHKPAAPVVAGPQPDCAARPGEGREAREALDLQLAVPTSAHPRRSHLIARVSLYSSLRKKPTLCRFATAGGRSGVVGRDWFSRSADLQASELCLAGGVAERVVCWG